MAGRLSAYAVLAPRFWAAVLPQPVVIPSLIREGNEGHDWERFDDEYAGAVLRDAAACLEAAGERTEAALVHRLLAGTDGDWGVPPWTSADEYTGYHQVPVSLLAEVQRRPAVGNPGAEDDWALVERTVHAPDAKRVRSEAWLVEQVRRYGRDVQRVSDAPS